MERYGKIAQQLKIYRKKPPKDGLNQKVHSFYIVAFVQPFDNIF
jgi:hypothetical protein